MLQARSVMVVSPFAAADVRRCSCGRQTRSCVYVLRDRFRRSLPKPDCGVYCTRDSSGPWGLGAMRITFYGTRGSIATPGPATVRYGGNTSCVVVRSGSGTLVVLDMGTGAAILGREL